MSAIIRKKLIFSKVNRAYAITDYKIQNNPEKQHEFRKQTVLADDILTDDEKSYAMKRLNQDFDYFKIRNNEGTKRFCENCQRECLATLYCEHCVRDYLKENFSNWTSGNNNIDNLIQKCQKETFRPDVIMEWIPYNSFQNIEYLTRGGFSKIFIADWIDGRYVEWDSKEKKLNRWGTHKVILKKLENVDSANRSWLEEGESHLMISNKCGYIVQCFGLTKNPSDGNYMLAMNKMDVILRNYLHEKHDRLTWKKRIRIADKIICALFEIHKRNNAIHRDLHSGNILYSQLSKSFAISDLGFCGPADKPLNSIYGNLPYIAPEVIAGKETTFASDIYSIGMLMWEVTSGQPPFADCDHDYDLAMDIINGRRPPIVPGTPLEYKGLMEQCWDADPEKRPDINTLNEKILDIRLNYQDKKLQTNSNVNNVQLLITNSSVSSKSIDSLARNLSKIHIFEGLPEPRNATKEEQEAYRSLQLGLSIPYNIAKDSVRMFDENNNEKSKSKRIHSNNSDDEKGDLIVKSKKLKLNDKKLKLNDNKEAHTRYINNGVEYQHMRKNYITIDDENEIHNDPNLHPEDQNELEIPEVLR